MTLQDIISEVEPYLPVQDKSYKIMDSSKFMDFMACPRLYFYRNILGWRRDLPAHDLIFGTAWHKAMEVLFEKGCTLDNIQEAYNSFYQAYRPYFPEETDGMYEKKNPQMAFQALINYVDTYEVEDKRKKTLMVEISGSAPIADNRRVHFRMDTVLEDSDGKIISIDHKTKGGDFNVSWENGLVMSFQTGTYTHVLHCLYPEEKVKGLCYSGTSFKFLKRSGGVIQFRRVPAYISYNQLSNWLYTANRFWDILEEEWKALKNSCISPQMTAFPLNTSNCTKYFGCDFMEFCQAWKNPLEKAFLGPPPGFRLEFFDPRDEDARNKIEI